MKKSQLRRLKHAAAIKPVNDWFEMQEGKPWYPTSWLDPDPKDKINAEMNRVMNKAIAGMEQSALSRTTD